MKEERPEEDTSSRHWADPAQEHPELHHHPLAAASHCHKLFTFLCALITPKPATISHCQGNFLWNCQGNFLSVLLFFPRVHPFHPSPNQPPDSPVCKNIENVGEAPRARECPISLEFVPHFAAGVFVTVFPSLGSSGSSEGKHVHMKCSPEPNRNNSRDMALENTLWRELLKL